MSRTTPYPAARQTRNQGLSWFSILRLGLVQAALGAIVVLTTSTLNRVMIVELQLSALIPGLLVGLHYGVQITRPVWGHKSDIGSSRTRWILGGLALLALSGTAAAATTFLFEQNFVLGLITAIIAYILIGMGIGACGTSLLALMALKTAPERRAAAATATWMLMIIGIILSSVVTGANLDPYSHLRLVTVTAVTGAVAFLIGWAAVAGIERKATSVGDRPRGEGEDVSFRRSLVEVWRDPQARLFTLFIFLSMLAYATQDLILEPFAGLLFGWTPGQTTSLSGTQHGGVLLGMALVGVLGTLFARRYPALPRIFIVAGCLGSAAALAALCLSTTFAPAWPLGANVFLLGAGNGAFAVAAIGMMMTLAGKGARADHGMRMGIWGAAQAVAFGLGGVLGTIVLDIGRRMTGDDATAFAIVFAMEAALFLAAALLALVLARPETKTRPHPTDGMAIPAE
ncbi:bacteriochlorophyll synthase [Rhizobium sp. Root274]|uniref:BCD family MFS transporter n=1 Tax=unclassified Rhizobium TaxID=2613769 RepID=UPI000712DCCC|nr:MULTISPECIES: BCD family MFS transporter [unclassified Rhizobium]KQW29638.1 bacteriochlorophyll synthase [Rhizobium sp. Root1240]KRD29830.1 bacteriochlorophyll synthase [Rhizobium sp. Root274]